MAIKLFVTDMDGTLLNNSRKISEGNKARIRQAVADGMIFTIATGRMYCSALPYAKELGVDVPIITYNGALIKSVSGKILYTSYLSADMIKEILDFCTENGMYVQSYSNDELIYREMSPQAAEYEVAAGVKGRAVGEAIYDMVENVPKLLVVTDSPEDMPETLDKLQKHFGDRLMITQSAPTYIEMVNPGVTKADAVLKLAELMGVPEDKVLTIGDAGNDVPMLKAVKYGVAMGNATSAAAAAASYHVGDNEHDGLAEAIDRFFYDLDR